MSKARLAQLLLRHSPVTRQVTLKVTRDLENHIAT